MAHIPGLPISAFLVLFLLTPSLSSHARESGWVSIEKSDATGRKAREAIRKGMPSRKAEPSRNAKAFIPTTPANGSTVYDGQPPVADAEVRAFVELLPLFRDWARKNGEEAHPVVNREGKPDFLYSPAAARWVENHKFEPRRFFCVMGRMAAGMVVVEEGNDFNGTRPADMPSVSSQEINLVRKHLGELLSAGGPPQPLK